MVSKKQPNPIDKHVGSRVRTARLARGISQEKLGDGLNLTFQQVQKYEKGTNRIGSSRLVQIANVLRVHPTFFFADDGHSEIADDFLTTHDGVRLARAFHTIKSIELKRKIVALVEHLGGEP